MCLASMTLTEIRNYAIILGSVVAILSLLKGVYELGLPRNSGHTEKVIL